MRQARASTGYRASAFTILVRILPGPGLNTNEVEDADVRHKTSGTRDPPSHFVAWEGRAVITGAAAALLDWSGEEEK